MKKLIIILSCSLVAFAALAIGITAWCIHIKNVPTQPNDTPHSVSKPEDDKEQVQSPVYKALSPIDLDGTYDTNSISISHKVETHNEAEVQIPYIEGLKDEKVQDKINSDIYNRVSELLKKHPDVNYGNYYTSGNFANALSMSYSLGFEEAPYYERILFNYNLVDGSEIKFEDLFMPDADILDIVRTGFYYSSLYSGGEWDHETDLFSPDENALFKAVKSFMDSEEKEFTFTPSEIYLYNPNSGATIKMINMPDRIAIYSRFLTEESIFTGEHEGVKNIFTCANLNPENFEKIEFGYIEDNLWYDISIFPGFVPDLEEHTEEQDAFTLFKEEKYNEVYDYLNQWQKTAKENPDTFYIFLSKPGTGIFTESDYNDGEWEYTYSYAAYFNPNITVYQMPIEVYESIYKSRLVDAYRYEYFFMAGGAYLHPEEEDNVTIKEIFDVKLYNYFTFEHLDSLEDVFSPDSNYMEVIEERVNEDLDYHGYTMDDFADEIKFEIEGTCVMVYIDSIDFASRIDFFWFEKDTMKLFEE